MLIGKGGFKSQVTPVAGGVVWNKHIITCKFLLQITQNADDSTMKHSISLPEGP